jgi:serine/threonine protein kinase
MRTLSRAIPVDCRLLRSDGLQRWFVHEPSLAGDEVRVIKQLAPSVTVDNGLVARWLQVAALNADLQHPACTQVEDWGVYEGAAYVVSRQASGVALRVLLEAVQASGASLAAELVAPIGVMILEALDYAQRREPALLHLDLDLEGITVRSDGSVVLPEFALWSVLSPKDVARCRFDSGRVQYCSPELVQSREGDCRSDVFSVGAVLYQLLTGELPFVGTTQLVVAMAIADGKRVAVRTRAPDAPESLCDILESMLATRAAERFQTPAAAANALRSTIRDGDRAPLRLPAALLSARSAELPKIGRLTALPSVRCERPPGPVALGVHAPAIRSELTVHDGRTAFLRERPRPGPPVLHTEPSEPPLHAPRVLSSVAANAPFVGLESVSHPLAWLPSTPDPLAASWLGSRKSESWLDPSETVFQAKVRPAASMAPVARRASALRVWSKPMVVGLTGMFVALAVLLSFRLL